MTIWKGCIENVSNLETLDTTYYPNYVCVFLPSENKWFALNQNATNTADGVNIITASPQGRWIAVNNEGFIQFDTVNSVPQAPPERINELVFFISSGNVYISTGTSAVSDWKIVPNNDVKQGTDNPTTLNVSPDFENQLFIDTNNKFLYISLDGTTWSNIILNDTTKTISNVTTATPATNAEKAGDLHFNENTKEFYIAGSDNSYVKLPSTEKTNLILDVSNLSDYTGFADVSDPVDLQVYFVPNYVDIATYNVARYGLAHTASTKQVTYLNNTVELQSNYDMSSFVESNGCGWYLLVPTYYDGSNYVTCGELSSLNVGMEMISNSHQSNVKIHNYTEGALNSETVIMDQLTLTGNIQALYVSNLHFSATVKLMPYADLADGSLK